MTIFLVGEVKQNYVCSGDNTMKINQTTRTLSVCIFVAAGTVSKASEYVPTGPAATANFEKELYNLLPGYVYGIFPKQEVLNRGVSKNDIPLYWTQMTERWLRQTLVPSLAPGPKTEIVMYGLPELRSSSDYIMGYYLTDKNSELHSRVEFQATDRNLAITIFMNDKIADINALSDEAILGILKKDTAVPEGKLSRISIEKTHKVLAGIPVCYGKMRCEFDERKDTGPDKEKNRQWWSYIPFWITEDKFFICISTIDWAKKKLPVSASSRIFKRDTEKDLKGMPRQKHEK
jgi:hypothetical protein